MKDIIIGEEFEILKGPNKGQKMLIHSIQLSWDSILEEYQPEIVVQTSFRPELITIQLDEFINLI